LPQEENLFMLFSGIVFETKMIVILYLAESEIEEWVSDWRRKKDEKKAEERV